MAAAKGLLNGVVVSNLSRVVTNHNIDTVTPAPLLGRHTGEELEEMLDLTPDEVEKLAAAGAL